MRVLVTGGSGFIGAHVVERLQQRGDDVAVLDVVAPEHDVEFVKASVLDADAVSEAVGGLDAVIHLAGFVRGGMLAQPYAGASLQLQGTLNVLEACRGGGVGRVGFASSFYVYDGRSAHEAVDESTPLDPLAMELFGSAKLMGEALCRQFAKRGEIEAALFRIGPVYGGEGSSAIDEFLATGLRGEAIEVWGRGERRNQYTFVDDVAEAVVAGLGRGNETYNLIAPEAVSLRSVGALLSERYGFRVTFDETRPEDASFPYISPAKAMDQLGWRPRPLHEGVEVVMRALRERTT